MSQLPPFSRLPRTLLWLAVLVMIALVTLGEPVSWAAPVTAPRNQTVPPGKTSIYLPTVHRTGTHSLIEVLKKNGRFNTLLQTLDAADLTTVLENTAGPFTLFAPTDAAFAQLPTGALEQLLENPTGQLTQILLFHVVSGEYELDDFENGMKITTQQGSSILVAREMDSPITINGASIVTPDLRASNGIIHAIDTVILPPPDEFPFILGTTETCMPNAGNTYFSGFVRDSNNNLMNDVCVHIEFYGPRGTKCSGCDGVGDGIWGFSPFGGPAPAGLPIEIYVVPCSGNMPIGGQTEQSGFGDLTPQSPKWTHVLNGSEQCTGITFYEK
jgi:uncharacterized surface protein with fasciclin (FAS1) repeats